MMEVESGCEWEAAAPGCCWRARTLPAADPCTVPIRASQRHGWSVGGGESRVAGLFDVYRVGGVRRACRRPKSEQSPAGVAAAALHITHSD